MWLTLDQTQLNFVIIEMREKLRSQRETVNAF